MSLAANRVVVSFDSVVKAWADTRSHPIWIVGHALLLVIPLGFTYLSQSSLFPEAESRILYGSLLGLGSSIISTLLEATYQREYLRFLRGEKPTLKGIFNTAMLEWKFIGLGTILYIPSLYIWIVQNTMDIRGEFPILVLYLLGLLMSLVFIPMFCFSRLILVDLAVGPIEALQRNWRFVMKAPFAILWMLILAFFASALGVIACGIGYLVTAPIFLLTQTVIYEENRKAGLPSLGDSG